MNKLAKEKSPYLLQHAENPVEWHPWGEDAFRKAREQDVPIFLSVGYATCHWCHVMAHESFEDKEVASILNRDFVSIKVDREERPDVDNIYMTACQAMTRGGGWPLSIFMTPEGKPFFAGTYYPKRSRMGMPGFMDLLERIASLWKTDRKRIFAMGEEVVQAIEHKPGGEEKAFELNDGPLKRASEQLAASFDLQYGGFGQAPKFPIPHNLTFLMRWFKRSGDNSAKVMVEKTLRSMRDGGIFDQLGFGFHRYSVDEQWLVPHFEKMLYDQAQLALAYVEASLCFDDASHAEVAREVFTYVLRDMTSPEGGFYSAEDADSEGREGMFYVWKPEQVKEILGRDKGDLVCRFYGIASGGNFEDGLSIPHVFEGLSTLAEKEGMPEAELEAVLLEAREELFQARRLRVPPLKDDKILTSWNGLMIAALATGARAMGDLSFAHAAARAADFVLDQLQKSRGRLLRRYRDGEAAFPGYLDDYAFFIWGLIDLYEATFDVQYLEEAVLFQEAMIDLFWDRTQGGFFFSGRDNETLVVKSMEAHDQAVPSGNSVAALNLVRLGRMTGNTKWEGMADRLVRIFSRSLSDYPVVHTQFLAALDFMIGPSREIVVAGDLGTDETQAMIRPVHELFLPNKVLLLNPTGTEGDRIRSLAPYLETMPPLDSRSTAYVCRKYACQRPVTDPEDLPKALQD